MQQVQSRPHPQLTSLTSLAPPLPTASLLFSNSRQLLPPLHWLFFCLKCSSLRYGQSPQLATFTLCFNATFSMTSQCKMTTHPHPSYPALLFLFSQQLSPSNTRYQLLCLLAVTLLECQFPGGRDLCCFLLLFICAYNNV